MKGALTRATGFIGSHVMSPWRLPTGKRAGTGRRAAAAVPARAPAVRRGGAGVFRCAACGSRYARCWPNTWVSRNSYTRRSGLPAARERRIGAVEPSEVLIWEMHASLGPAVG